MAQAEAPGIPASLPSLLTQLIALRFFHCPCFLQNHPTGGVLTSGVRFLSGLLRFALLTSAAQDYLPKSKQKGLTLLGKRLGEAGWVTHWSLLCGSAGEAKSFETFIHDHRLTLTHGHGKIHPTYVGVDNCEQILTILFRNCMCPHVCFVCTCGAFF